MSPRSADHLFGFQATTTAATASSLRTRCLKSRRASQWWDNCFLLDTRPALLRCCLLRGGGGAAM